MDKNLKDNADKLFRIQKQAKEDVKTMQSYISDLLSWEAEMKRKEAALKGAYEQDLPPVRSKKKRFIQTRESKPETRISAADYAAWDKFDVDKACEQVDMAEVGPSSLDSAKSLLAKNAKLNEEAAYEKERGNNFVKQEKWEEAIKCYSRAIEIDNQDAIFYANRALCYLKIDKLHNADTDCTHALRLDSTYVKALLRRATARERLGSLKSASEDLNKVLQYEPRNTAARAQLAAIQKRMGSKGGNPKSSPQRSPTAENRPPVPTVAQPVKEPASKAANTEVKIEKTPLDEWREGTKEGITVINPVRKPPHLRSKRPLKPISIKEIQLGKTSPETKPTRILITEVDDMSHGDTNNNKPNDTTNVSKIPGNKGDMPINSIETKKLEEIAKETNKNTEFNGEVNKNDVNEKNSVSDKDNKSNNDKILKDNDKRVLNLVVPYNSVQFLLEWRSLKDVDGARSDYMSIIDPKKIPTIFDNALESDVLSSVLYTLAENPEKFRKNTITAYLQGLAGTKRFSTLAMFLSSKDKHLVNNLLVQCKEREGTSDDVINDLKNKFEI